MGISLAKTFDDAVNEGGLRQGDGAGGAIVVNGNAQCEFGWTQLGDFPAGLEEVLELVIFLR
jgi:hypothetical protein